MSTCSRGFFRHYRLVDFATGTYVLVVSLLLVVFGRDRTPGWEAWLLAHGIVLAVVHGVVTAQGCGHGGRWLAAARHLYPIVLFTGFYREAAELNRMVCPEYLDPILIRWEASLFGGQPSLGWMERFPYRWVSEPLYAAYFSFYPTIAGLGIALYRRDRRQFAHFVTVLSLVFYVCYLTYICLPVIGPPLFFLDRRALGLPAEAMPAVIPPFPAAVEAGFFFRLMRWIYEVFEAPGAAFPSSHVAVALVTLAFSFRYFPRFARVHLPVVALLVLATVYCRYHYVLDALAGGVTAAVLLPLADAVHRRFERTDPACPVPAGDQSTARS